MRRGLYLGAAFAAVLFGGVIRGQLARRPAASRMPPVLHQLASNNRFFADPNGNAVWLAGSHTWNESDDIGLNNSPTTMDFNQLATFLDHHGMNVTILWRKDMGDECNWNSGQWTMTPQPYLRTATTGASDGGNKYDLTQFNQAFFDNVRQRAIILANHGIYAIVEIFDGNNVTSARCGNSSPTGDGYPFTSVNNINGIDDGYTSGACGVGSFTMTAANATTDVQEAMVRKFVDTVADLPNVLFEVAEEEPGTSFSSGCQGYGGASTMTFWAPRMRDAIVNYEKTKPYQHLVGIGSFNSADYVAGESTLYNSTFDWIGPMLSNNFSNQCASNACLNPTNNQNKLVINDSDHTAGPSTLLNANATVNTATTHLWVWGNLTAGAAGIIFMDPYRVSWTSGAFGPQPRNTCGGVVNGICLGALDTKYEDLRLQMGWASYYANKKMDLAKATPQGSLASTGFCLAQNVAVGGEFLIYATSNAAFTVNLSAQNTRVMKFEWFDLTKGTVISSGNYTATSSTTQSFTPPAGVNADVVLYLVDAAGHN